LNEGSIAKCTLKRSIYVRVLASIFVLVRIAQPGGVTLVCATCHPNETKAYLKSAMGRSIGPPDLTPPGQVADSQSGSEIKSAWRGKSLFHSVSEDGLQAEYEIRYQIGAGKVGHSYAVVAGDFLLESPASYYTHFGWDVSPGFRGAELLDFNRVLSARCLFCHSNSANFTGSRRINGEPFTAISCERCHRPTGAYTPALGREHHQSGQATDARSGQCLRTVSP
jgi:hypothetical protein